MTINWTELLAMVENDLPALAAAMPAGEPKKVLEVASTVLGAVRGTMAAAGTPQETVAQKMEAVAAAIMPHVIAALPAAMASGPVGTVAGIVVSALPFLAELVTPALTPVAVIVEPEAVDPNAAP